MVGGGIRNGIIVRQLESRAGDSERERVKRARERERDARTEREGEGNFDRFAFARSVRCYTSIFEI